jgi:uncharacterized damage-inducible protein DinB
MADEAQIAELSQKMIEEREKLLAALESLTEEEAERSPSDGDWNAKQQMSHLCEMESAYRAWVARALEEDGANVEGVRGERVAIPLEEANGHKVAEHVAEMRHTSRNLRGEKSPTSGALSPSGRGAEAPRLCHAPSAG